MTMLSKFDKDIRFRIIVIPMLQSFYVFKVLYYIMINRFKLLVNLIIISMKVVESIRGQDGPP